jgi:DNA mismatch repair protein MutL
MSESRIRVLDRIVADQIAAGEVVDRPASVVKELVENALDAGATRVQVDIDGGGATRIRVLDNGVGMRADEVETAFARHATSKIARIEDLDRIVSFGFRGEALPSIASVSRITLRTRTVDALAGEQIELEGGELVVRREVGCPTGTEIEVRDLFFNTPARLKFLKRESTEASHCAEALTRIALVRPDVAFKLVTAGRRTRDLPRAERVVERVAALFKGESLARAQGSEDGVEVVAVLGPPERSRAGAGSMYTYVKGRFVRDRALLKAVTQAFGGTLEQGRYPVGLIALDLPAGAVDINVHPQKTEVRFADPRAIYRAVSRTIAELVSRAVWARGGVDPAPTPQPEGIAEQAQPYAGGGRLVPPPPLAGTRQKGAAESTVGPAPASPGGPVPLGQSELLVGDAKAGAGSGEFCAFDFIGQARGTFLMFDDGDDLVVVDQHAAHERITYEKLRAQLESGRIASQRLLTAHQVDLGPAEADRIAGRAEDLGRLGLEVARAGPDRIAIHGVPAELGDVAPDRLLADMLIALEQGREGSRGDLEDRVLATMACHGSIRAGRSLTEDEVKALIGEMEGIDIAGHCPHGRPVLARIPWREIRRRVGRG